MKLQFISPVRVVQPSPPKAGGAGGAVCDTRAPRELGGFGAVNATTTHREGARGITQSLCVCAEQYTTWEQRGGTFPWSVAMIVTQHGFAH